MSFNANISMEETAGKRSKLLIIGIIFILFVVVFFGIFEIVVPRTNDISGVRQLINKNEWYLKLDDEIANIEDIQGIYVNIHKYLHANIVGVSSTIGAPTPIPTQLPTPIPSLFHGHPTSPPTLHPTNIPPVVPTSGPTVGGSCYAYFTAVQLLQGTTYTSFAENANDAYAGFENSVARTMSAIDAADVNITKVAATSSSTSAIVTYTVKFTSPGQAGQVQGNYEVLLLQLNSSVYDGMFTYFLQEYATQYNVPCLTSAFSDSMVSISEPTVTECIAPPSFSPTPAPSQAPTRGPTRPTLFPTIIPTAAPTPLPTTVPTVVPSKQPTRQPSKQPTRQPSKQPTRQPSKQPTRQPSKQPTRQPSKQPTRQPSKQPTRQPSKQPTRQPSKQPTRQPSKQPTRQPSKHPTRQPSDEPTQRPSKQPSIPPTSQPSTYPLNQPTFEPSGHPSSKPIVHPSEQPSLQPTAQPSPLPTSASLPSLQPSPLPSSQPSLIPSSQPFNQPSRRPSKQPSRQPSRQPSKQPTQQPTRQPSRQPTSTPGPHSPTNQPSLQPTRQPSKHPTKQPSRQPSRQPTRQPTRQPSKQPTRQPSRQPTRRPSRRPTRQPSRQPTRQPSRQPTLPSVLHQPTSQPSLQPTKQPTRQPSKQPSSHPSTAARPPTSPTPVPLTSSFEPTPASYVVASFSVNQVLLNVTASSIQASKNSADLTIEYTVASCMTDITYNNVNITAVVSATVNRRRLQANSSSFTQKISKALPSTSTSASSSSSSTSAVAAPPTGAAVTYTVTFYAANKASVSTEYAILSAQLTTAVSDGFFNTTLHYYAKQFGASCLLYAYSASLSINQPVIISSVGSPTLAPTVPSQAATAASGSPAVNGGLIAGIVIAAFFIFAAGGAAFYFARKKAERDRNFENWVSGIDSAPGQTGGSQTQDGLDRNSVASRFSDINDMRDGALSVPPRRGGGQEGSGWRGDEATRRVGERPSMDTSFAETFADDPENERQTESRQKSEVVNPAFRRLSSIVKLRQQEKQQGSTQGAASPQLIDVHGNGDKSNIAGSNAMLASAAGSPTGGSTSPPPGIRQQLARLRLAVEGGGAASGATGGAAGSRVEKAPRPLGRPEDEDSNL